MAGVDLPLLLDAYPPLYAGEEGERYIRPSEKKHEAKDLNKFLQKGAASMGRIAQPLGMALGGGMYDYAMRGETTFTKTLTWAGVTSGTSSSSTSPASSSVIRYHTYPIGALADVSASWDVKDIAQPCAQGVPIQVTAVQRTKGAFMFEQEIGFYYDVPIPGQGAAAVTFSSTPSYFVSSSVNRRLPLAIAHGTNAAASTTVMGLAGYATAKTIWKFAPPEKDDIGQTVDGAVVTMNSIKYFCLQTLSYSSVAALNNGATASNEITYQVRHFGRGYIPIASDITTIWLDWSLQNNVDSDPNTNFYDLWYSRGTTLSGHDGYPYNYAIGDN